MNYYEKLLYIREIKEKLIDDESKAIFDAKIDYMVTGNEESFVKEIWPFLNNMCCPDLSSHAMTGRNIVIFGSGHDGILTKKVLELCGYCITCFCDSDRDKEGKAIEGLMVISPEQLAERYKDCLVVLGSRVYLEEMYQQLVQMNFPTENIVLPEHRILLGCNRMQYFDVFGCGENEVFLDAGAYNGDTTKDFMAWTGGRYKKAIVLEPLEEQFEHIRNRSESEGWNNIELYKNAAWNCKESLNFEVGGAGSHIVKEKAGLCVEGMDIDSIVNNEKVTYIKMDIEGSELQALEGARKTIRTSMPRLAVCVYHKQQDIIDIPLKILSLMPDYKFYLRHYCTNSWETVLYATV